MPSKTLTTTGLRIEELRAELVPLELQIATWEARIGRAVMHPTARDVDPATGKETYIPAHATYEPADSLQALAHGAANARALVTERGGSSGEFAVLQYRAREELRWAPYVVSSLQQKAGRCRGAIARLQAGLPEAAPDHVTEHIVKRGDTAELVTADQRQGRPEVWYGPDPGHAVVWSGSEVGHVAT